MNLFSSLRGAEVEGLWENPKKWYIFIKISKIILVTLSGEMR
jgi:hypothetical protein